MRNAWMMILALGTASNALAEEGRFQITPRAGFGDMRIEAGQGVNEEEIDIDTVNLGGAFGYATFFGLVIEAGIEMQTDGDIWNVGDEFTLTHQYVALGYEIEFRPGWRFTPKVGRTNWKLESDESFLFNPGPEEEKDIDGYDYFWEVQLTRRVSDSVALGASYRRGEFDFGRASSLSFVATFEF